MSEIDALLNSNLQSEEVVYDEENQKLGEIQIRIEQQKQLLALAELFLGGVIAIPGAVIESLHHKK